MSQKKIEVPEGMLKAATAGLRDYWRKEIGDRDSSTEAVLEAVLLWLDSELEKMKVPNRLPWQAGRNAAIEEIRRMFLAPESEIPEQIKDLLCAGADTVKEAYFRPDIYNERILEAFRRGQRSKP